MSDSHRCDECGVEFARSDDATMHRYNGHQTKPSTGIREAIDRLRDEDRELLEKLGEH